MRLIPGNKSNDDFETPELLAKRIIDYFKPSGTLLEPCRGTGNFYRYMNNADWCEIKEGRDFMDYNGRVDWIITNPPFSKFRAFLNKSMEVADNVVFLATVNHFWLKARQQDIKHNGFWFKEILLCETPFSFPPSGFQIGIVHLKRNWSGETSISWLKEGA